jgi:hypothetical protein
MLICRASQLHVAKGIEVMKSRSWFQKVATYVAGVALIVGQTFVQPQQLLAADVPTKGPQDVALNSEGILYGSISGKSGNAAAGVPIEIRQGKVVLASTRTDNEGRFAVGALRGGVYQMQIAEHQVPVRIWTDGTAPPTATDGISLNTGLIARGQGCTTSSCTGECGGTCDACCGGRQGGVMGLLMNPIVIGAAIAAAIAIPLALDDDDDAS